MGHLNPTALNLWLFGGSLGYVLGQGHGLAQGLVSASCSHSSVASLLPFTKRQGGKHGNVG